MITLALEVACLLCPRRVTSWLVLGAMNSQPACPALLQFYCAFASERWAGLRLEGPDAPVTPFCGRVGRVLQPARGKVTWSQVWFGARVLVPYLCPCPEPSQGRRGFFQGGRRRCQPGRAQGYPACQVLTWLLKPVCLQSPFPCCSLLEFPRKEARKRPGEQRPHPASSVACPSCWAFSLLLGLSRRGPQHFEQLSKVCVCCLGKISSYLFWELFRREALWSSMRWFQSPPEHPWPLPLARELHADSLLPSQGNLMGHCYPMRAY